MYKRQVLDDVSFDVYGGEILGIAGISGNGQKELLEAIAGLQHTESGSDVKFFAPGEEDKPMELLGKSPKEMCIRDRCRTARFTSSRSTRVLPVPCLSLIHIYAARLGCQRNTHPVPPHQRA